MYISDHWHWRYQWHINFIVCDLVGSTLISKCAGTACVIVLIHKIYIYLDLCQGFIGTPNKEMIQYPCLTFAICENISQYKLDMDTWMACQCLKSPQPVSHTSTHPTIYTQRTWSWIIDSSPSRSMLIAPPILKISRFQTLKLESQYHSVWS